jgi:hypothetical protein
MRSYLIVYTGVRKGRHSIGRWIASMDDSYRISGQGKIWEWEDYIKSKEGYSDLMIQSFQLLEEPVDA